MPPEKRYPLAPSPCDDARVTTAVRRIKAGEGMRWQALRLRALVDTPIAFMDTVEQAVRRPDTEWHDAVAAMSTGCQSALFIAERGDDWVGVAGGFASGDTMSTVFTVFIDPAARGQQVLEALLGAVAEWSLSCGRETLSLEVALQNPRAVAAYHRLGFLLTGESRPHPLYQGVTEVEMIRAAAPNRSPSPNSP